MTQELPIPPHFHPDKVGEIWKVPYQDLAQAAQNWVAEHTIQPASKDRFRTCLIAVDVQNTFCIPGFELYVGGQSGTAAVDDTRRLCEFIYRNLKTITHIVPTMDTHQTMQIFHGIFLVNECGEHPVPFTRVTVEDVSEERWKFNPLVGQDLQIGTEYGKRHLEHYTQQLRASGKYELTIWPYHSMLGGIGHALVPALEEAIFFHTMTRYSQPAIHLKGNHPLTEHYSVLGPEVTSGPDGKPLAQKTDKIFQKIKDYDAVIIAGEAKSHCVTWTIADLLEDIREHRNLVEKVYLLEDCTSPIVVSGVIDYSEEADAAFARFADAGMHVVRTSDPIANWVGIRERMAVHGL
jgi:hypothetical protein